MKYMGHSEAINNASVGVQCDFFPNYDLVWRRVLDLLGGGGGCSINTALCVCHSKVPQKLLVQMAATVRRAKVSEHSRAPTNAWVPVFVWPGSRVH
jgi:hypothetical protein